MHPIFNAIISILFLLLGFCVGQLIFNKEEKEYKEPLIPTIKIETINGVSDTTYIYRL